MDRHFHEEIEAFNTNILKMAELTESAIDESFRALRDQDVKLAEDVIQRDKEIDELEIIVGEMAIGLLALNQPMAVDLRSIATGMYVDSELEMIADLVVNIAQRALELSDKPLLMSLIDIERLTGIAKVMVKEASDSFIKKDEELARRVIVSDKESNELRDKIINELVNDYMVKDGGVAPRAVPLLLVARDLERICDHAVAIAEDVVYMIRATVVKHHRERLENGNG